MLLRAASLLGWRQANDFSRQRFFLAGQLVSLADIANRGCAQRALPGPLVSLIMSDMKTLTMRDLNRKTASVLDAVERGETFELRRNGRAVGYIIHTPPKTQPKPDWKTHFDWLRGYAAKADARANHSEAAGKAST